MRQPAPVKLTNGHDGSKLLTCTKFELTDMKVVSKQMFNYSIFSAAHSNFGYIPKLDLTVFEPSVPLPEKLTKASASPNSGHQVHCFAVTVWL